MTPRTRPAPASRSTAKVSSVASRVWMTTGRSQLDAPARPARRTPRAGRRAARSRSGSRGRSRRSPRRRCASTAARGRRAAASAARPGVRAGAMRMDRRGEPHRRPRGRAPRRARRARRLRRPTECTARRSTPAACARATTAARSRDERLVGEVAVRVDHRSRHRATRPDRTRVPGAGGCVERRRASACRRPGWRRAPCRSTRCPSASPA